MSRTHENRVVGYIKPISNRLITAEAKLHGVSKSELINQAISERYDRMPVEQRQRLLHS